MDSAQNKAKTVKIIRAWCDKCRAEMTITVPRDKEPKCCPMCRRKILVESIRYA